MLKLEALKSECVRPFAIHKLPVRRVSSNFLDGKYRPTVGIAMGLSLEH